MRLPRVLEVSGSIPGRESSICGVHLHRASGVHAYCTGLQRVGVTASQVDLQSLMPLSVASCGRLQLGAAHRATSVALL